MTPRRSTVDKLKIGQPKQLLVEGNDSRNFFEALIKHLNKARARAYMWTREKPHVLVGVAAQTGQSATNQIDCLADIGAALGNTENRLWNMRNGYALPSYDGLVEKSPIFSRSSPGSFWRRPTRLRSARPS